MHVQHLRPWNTRFIRDRELVQIQSDRSLIETLSTVNILLAQNACLGCGVGPDEVLGIPGNVTQLLVAVDGNGAECQVLATTEAQIAHGLVYPLVEDLA